MAVYTDVSDEELDAFIGSYAIGALTSFKGIAEGVENSNYLVHTESGRYILTLYEKRVSREDLPYFLALMEHLAARGITCPLPVHDRAGPHAEGACRAACGAHHLPRRLVGAETRHRALRGSWASARPLPSGRPRLPHETGEQPVPARMAGAVRRNRQRRRPGHAWACGRNREGASPSRRSLAGATCRKASSMPTSSPTMSSFSATRFPA